MFHTYLNFVCEFEQQIIVLMDMFYTRAHYSGQQFLVHHFSYEPELANIFSSLSPLSLKVNLWRLVAQVFMGWMLFLSPKIQCQSTEWNPITDTTREKHLLILCCSLYVSHIVPAPLQAVSIVFSDFAITTRLCRHLLGPSPHVVEDWTVGVLYG